MWGLAAVHAVDLSGRRPGNPSVAPVWRWKRPNLSELKRAGDSTVQEFSMCSLHSWKCCVWSDCIYWNLISGFSCVYFICGLGLELHTLSICFSICFIYLFAIFAFVTVTAEARGRDCVFGLDCFSLLTALSRFLHSLETLSVALKKKRRHFSYHNAEANLLFITTNSTSML